MLSRVADNLYWLGRYIERTEHFCRYLRVQYFSSLESPLEKQNEMALRSVMHMVGLPEKADEDLQEEEILVGVAFDEENPSSIKSSVQRARENARGVRDVISTELWQIINKFYRFIYDYSEGYYRTQGIYDFTQTTIENCAIIKHNIQNTLLHDDVWAFINMGLHLERAVQINRMIISKLNDLKHLEEDVAGSIHSYQLSILLKSAEGMDMYRKVYKSSPNLNNTLEFLILNPSFPRSISYNIAHLQDFLWEIRPHKEIRKSSIEWSIGRMKEYLTYTTVEEVEKKPEEFCEKTLDYIYNLNILLSKEYLSY